jgi:competence protein ComEC
MPFGAYHFGRIQLYFIPANMLAVPLTALWVMPAGMAALGLMPFGLERLALVPMGWGIDLVLRVGRAVSALPDATLPVPHMAPAGLALLALGMAWLGIWRGKVRLAGVVAIALGIASAWFVRPPDLLVSPDARLIGVRTAAGVFVAENGKDGFTRDAFRQFWGADTLRPLPPAGDVAGDVAGGAIRCDAGACLIRPRPEGAAALLLRRRGIAACAGAAVLVAPEPARGVCPRGVALVDRFTVWRYGADANWLDKGGVRLLSDAAWRGRRPWVIAPTRARRRAPAGGLPMAGSDRSSR